MISVVQVRLAGGVGNKTNLDLVDSLILEVDSGLYGAKNKGISIARGSYAGILNSEDEFLPETLSLVSKYLESNPDSQVVYGHLLMGEIITDVLVVPIDEISTRMIPHPRVFVSLKTYCELGVFNTEYEVAADYELIFRSDWWELNSLK